MDRIKALWETAKTVAIIAVVAICAYYCHMYEKEKALREQASLSANVLPPGILAQYTLENRRLVEAVKNAQGKTEIRTTYVPDEGKVIVVTKERDAAIARYNELMEKLKVVKSTAELAGIIGEMTVIAREMNKPPETKVVDHGFTSRFGLGVVGSPFKSLRIQAGDVSFNLPVAPALDWKFYYLKRYSAILQINPYYGGPGVTRHVDDFTPRWLHANNLELGLSGGPSWTGGWMVGTNLRTNF
jgi:hypothetical protein